jgi:hypothetical protein
MKKILITGGNGFIDTSSSSELKVSVILEFNVHNN